MQRAMCSLVTITEYHVLSKHVDNTEIALKKPVAVYSLEPVQLFTGIWICLTLSGKNDVVLFSYDGLIL